MKIQEHVSLASFTTFMVQAHTRFFAEVTSLQDIIELVETDTWKNYEHCFLGGGSNVLFVSDYQGLVIVNQIQGLEIVSEDETSIGIRVGAGENWHHLVLWSLDQNLWGIENLVLIPGTVGAAPVQNIGAYGVEVSDTITSVEVFDTFEKKILIFDRTQCEFSYRESVFKNNPGRYFITHVNFLLSKNSTPQLSYPKITETLESLGLDQKSPQHIAQAIIQVRDSKLPRIGDLGTAGSFFQNPIVKKELAEMLLIKFPEMIQFPNSKDEMVKLSAAWMIEYCGYKGRRLEKVGTYEKHALVLVNHGGAYGHEVWAFAKEIVDHVYEIFGVTLEPEVQVIGKE